MVVGDDLEKGSQSEVKGHDEGLQDMGGMLHDRRQRMFGTVCRTSL